MGSRVFKGWGRRWGEAGFEEVRLDARSKVMWCRSFIGTEETRELLEHLNETVAFHQTMIPMYGRTVAVPRLQAWFADEDFSADEYFLGLLAQRQTVWTEPMKRMKERIETCFNTTFEYCVVNLYRDGQDYIGFHADNEAAGAVVWVSLGTTRRFVVRHVSCFGKTRTRRQEPLTVPDKKEHCFELGDGSVLGMLGDTQQHWKHAVPRQTGVVGARISLTFRTRRHRLQ